MPDGTPPRVFISYSHDDAAHEERVLRLANRLRAEGIDASVDQYVQPFPPEGWEEWSEAQVRTADFVVMVSTETYLQRFNRDALPGVGPGCCGRPRRSDRCFTAKARPAGNSCPYCLRAVGAIMFRCR
jgi:hypothetical protein